MVTVDSEIARALSTPRKTTKPDRDLIESLCGWTGDPERRLSDDQILVLWEIWESEGLLGSIGVGLGKSLLSLLAASILGALNPVILVKPNLVQNLLAQYEEWRPFFDIVPFQYLQYTKLSQTKNHHSLWDMKPDLIICDEAQCLKNMDSARAVRGLAYVVENPTTKVIVMSGTITTQSVADYAHLSELALRDRSPVPHYDSEACKAWARVLGAKPDAFGTDFALVRPLIEHYPNKADTFTDRGREAMRQHLMGTRGVVMTSRSSCDAALEINLIDEPQLPKAVLDAQVAAQVDCVDPDGKGISVVEQDLIINHLQFGFWYRKIWNRPELEEEWRLASSAWNQAVSAYLKRHATPGLDSPALLRDAVVEGRFGPDILEVYERYEKVSKVAYRLQPVWLWEGWIEKQLAWLKKHDGPAIAWYLSGAVGQRIKDAGFPVYARKAVIDPRVPHKCGMSIHAMREGHNLQKWNRQRILQLPADAGIWQQMLARTHRQGQLADEVYADVVAHTRKLKNTFKQACHGAKYIEKTTSERQRLSLATIIGGQ